MKEPFCATCHASGALLFLAALGSPAAAVIVFRPNSYTRTSGKPDVFQDVFYAPAKPEPGWTIQVLNGEKDGSNRISSAVLRLNGVDILPGSFNQTVYEVRRDVSDLIKPVNDVYIELRGGPGGYLSSVKIASATSGNILLCPVLKDPATNGVKLVWSGGGPTYDIYRSMDAQFRTGNAMVAQGVLGTADTDCSGGPAVNYVDQGVLNDGVRYFYQILDAGSQGPGLFDLNPPRLRPTITLLTPDTGVPGDTVTIDGTNFPEDGGALTVMFGAELADITAINGTTELVVTVPAAAVTDDVVVCVAGLCSNRLLFKVPLGTDTYSNITSLGFEPGTGSLFVGDAGSNDRLYEIDSSRIRINRTGLGEIVIGAPEPGDGSGRIYYSNGTISTFNKGTTRCWDSSTNSSTTCTSAGTASSDPVWCRGIARDPNTSTRAEWLYWVDGNTLKVRQYRCNAGQAAMDKNYGNFTFSEGFSSPAAGARFDSAGNLYVSSVTTVYKIDTTSATPTWIPVVTGFVGAAGFDLSERSGLVMLLVADQAQGKVFLANAATGEKTEVASGLASPRATAFYEDVNAGDLFYAVAEKTRILLLPDPVVEFDIKKDRDPNARVLIHKYRTDDPFPSKYQQEIADKNGGSADGQIKITGHVTDGGDAEGVKVHLQVMDPRDGSPYNRGSKNDNKGGLGTLSEPNPTTNTHGSFETVLTITDQFSGDNYQIEACLDKPGKPCSSSFKPSARSGVLRAWKRAYVEYDRMYKVGEFLVADSGASTPFPDRIYVANPGVFLVNDLVHVFSGTVGTDTSFQRGEKDLKVIAIGGNYLQVNQPLTCTYLSAGSSDPSLAAAPYSFVARQVMGFYDSNPTSLELAKASDDAYLEWVFVDGGSFVPAWTNVEGADQTAVSQFIDGRSPFFFKNFEPNTGVPSTNHVQLVAAAFPNVSAPPFPYLGLSSAKNTLPSIGSNWSWNFTQAAALDPTTTNLPNVLAGINIHELIHQWNVNQGNLVGGHDMENAWCGGCPSGPIKWCLMRPAPDYNLGVYELHKKVTPGNGDLFCIRGHVDDLNQDTCDWPP